MKCPFCIKVCTTCNKILVANEINFNKKKNGKFGLESKCKKCRKEYQKEWREENKEYYKEWREENKEYYKEYQKQWREENEEYIREYKQQYYEDNKDDIKEYKKQWYEENKEYCKEQRRKYYKNNKNNIKENVKQWRENNPEKVKQWRENNPEKVKQWRENNPEKVFNQHQRRRQLEEEQGNGISKEQWLEMMEFFDWECAYSGIEFSSYNKDKDRTIDHIIPLSEGGENEIWNLIPMYMPYNSSKGTSNMEDWYMEQDFFDIDRLLKIYEWIEYAWSKWGK